MRLTIQQHGTADLFVQGEWATVMGNHAKRLTEELPPAILKAVQDIIGWAETYEQTILTPNAIVYQERRDLENLIAKAQARLAQLRG